MTPLSHDIAPCTLPPAPRTGISARVRPMQSHINVGYGEDVTIAELAALIREVVGYSGRIQYDRTKPDGTPRKLLDSSLLNKMGWMPQTDLRRGLAQAYADFVATHTTD